MFIQDEEKFDLHCHSIYSDGVHSPIELIDKAKTNKLRGISITDHDSVGAYQDGVYSHAQTQGVMLIPGIEVSAQYDGNSVHVLGYGIDTNHRSLIEFCNKQSAIRLERNQKIIQMLQSKGIELSYDDLYKDSNSKTIGRVHIAKALMERRIVFSMKEAFETYLANGKSCHVMGDFPKVNEVISVIHQAGGKAFLAHPYCLEDAVLCQVLKSSFDGIEAYYSRVPLSRVKRWLSYAKNKNWLVSGGSDYHMDLPALDLGRSYLLYSDFKKLELNGFSF